MKKPAEAAAPNPGPPLDEGATIDILKIEYTALLNLYTHTEDTIFSIFNFYLTLLSAVVGAIIVLIQINSADLSNALPSIGGLLAATVLIGVIMQDAIVNKNIELSTHVLGINLLKHRLFSKWPEEMSNIFFINNFWARVHPTQKKPQKYRPSRFRQRFWWLIPLGTHQLFIGVINSLALSGLVIITASLLSGNSISAGRLGIAVIFMFGVSFEVHTIYARLKHQNGIESIATLDGSDVAWISDRVTSKKGS